MKKKEQPFSVLCIRVRLWIIAHYSAGGHRRKAMTQVVKRYEAALGEVFGLSEEQKAVAIVQRGMNESNVRNILKWLMSVKSEEGKRLPTSFTMAIKGELKAGETTQ